MSKPALDSFPAKYQAQIIAQLHNVKHPKTVRLADMMPAEKKRIRQNSAGLNKTEAAFLDFLKRDKYAAIDVLTPQSITLRIANGCRYTPDFFTVEHQEYGHTIRAYEVKGFMRDDAAVKLKVAASLYPWIKFHLVSKGKGGTWNVQEVLA
jgi:hypothetical protein